MSCVGGSRVCPLPVAYGLCIFHGSLFSGDARISSGRRQLHGSPRATRQGYEGCCEVGVPVIQGRVLSAPLGDGVSGASSVWDEAHGLGDEGTAWARAVLPWGSSLLGGMSRRCGCFEAESVKSMRVLSRGWMLLGYSRLRPRTLSSRMACFCLDFLLGGICSLACLLAARLYSSGHASLQPAHSTRSSASRSLCLVWSASPCSLLGKACTKERKESPILSLCFACS